MSLFMFIKEPAYFVRTGDETEVKWCFDYFLQETDPLIENNWTGSVEVVIVSTDTGADVGTKVRDAAVDHAYVNHGQTVPTANVFQHAIHRG